uniref:Cas scaffold protein family member 4 n=1 Tax=Oryzias latipes TaxID=8090 RepID=H2M048_ORYLA
TFLCNKLAKALYDNTAECADELAFRKGDILTVLDQNVSGTSEWWRCLLYGRHGLAPANRLKLLPQPVATENSLNQETERANDNGQNIYQIPSVPRVITSPVYEPMKAIYKVPSAPPSTSIFSPENYSLFSCLQPPFFNMASSPKGEVYDVPSQARPASFFTVSTCKHQNCTFASPPPLDPNYDIPVPSSSELQHKTITGYSTLPNLRTPEWIYDVPAGLPRHSYNTLSPKTICSQPTDTNILCSPLIKRNNPASSLYDIPKSHSLEVSSPPKLLSRVPSFEKPPTLQLNEEFVYDVPPRKEELTQAASDTSCGNQLLEFSSSSSSSSSTSSCDSLALSSSSPELLREVTLSPDEVCHKLLELQNSVVRAVPQLMVFVSSSWRHQEHLKKHLKEIRDAAELVSQSLLCFLNFTLDIKGNARRLTDTNLKTRLYKQLSIVEDSGVILQQTVKALNSEGWPLDKLCQDSGQVQTPDQLDRFVMVARTVPDDVMRLVSIINANGKLLFRVPQKSAEPVSSPATGDAKKCSDANKQDEDSVEDNNDYIGPDNQHPSSDKGTEEHKKSPMSEHCRLYFGALQKAIVGFVGSVSDGQPPEKFISQSKLVIMVGQRLVDTLCREAQREKPNQTLLCKSNHLCALLKQLAVATKKAALHFPDKQALSEAQEFAKELAQRAQHFRISLDL